MIAEFGPGGVGGELDAGDLGGRVLGEEDVVSVTGEERRFWLSAGPEDVDLFFDGSEVLVAGG